MHNINYRIYYEDTDAGGVVYYANYLKFAERARTEFLREKNINQSTLSKEQDILFVVRKAELEIFKPARLDDLITIETSVSNIKAARIFMEQNIYLEKTKLCTIQVQLVTINNNFRPIRLNQNLQTIFEC